MRVAIVHDYLTQRGGAERVVLAMHRMFPGAPIYTSLYDPRGTFAEFRDADVRTSFMQPLPHSGNRFRAYLPLYPAAFGTLRLSGYDAVISSSSGWAHGVRVEGGHHLCYCYTPPRWLYRTDTYLADGGPVPHGARSLTRPVLAALRRWDQRAAARPDTYVAISQGIAWRIRRAYGRHAEVVYPPVDVERFPVPVGATHRARDGGFYLVVARLLAYKRIDLAVRACTERGARLVVVGEGPASRELERIAGPTVEFRRAVPEAELLSLYAECNALIQCGEEDFGIALLEANAAGRPVIAYSAGGALETVVHGETGVLFREQRVESVSRAMERFEGHDWDPIALRRHAHRFDESRFAESLTRVLAARLGAIA